MKLNNVSGNAPLQGYFRPFGHSASLPSPDWKQWLIAVGILAIAATIRFFHIGLEPLWLDEGYSWWDAQQSLPDLWNLVPQCDPHPPLYFLLLKGWIYVFGDSSRALRALSATFGVATTALVILAARQLEVRSGWLAGCLFALTPFEIVYSREARPYALLCFGVALLLYGTLRIVRISQQCDSSREPIAESKVHIVAPVLLVQSKWAWFSMLAGGSIVLWSNNTAIFTVIAAFVACGTWVLFDRSARWALGAFVMLGIMLIAFWLPYLPTLLEQTRGVIADFWIPTPGAGYIADVLSNLISFNSRDALLCIAFILVAGLWLMWHRQDWRAALVLGCFIAVPVALNYAMSITLKPIFLPRALIGITPPVVIVLAASASLIKGNWRNVAITLMLLVHVLVLYRWQLENEESEPWDRIAQALSDSSQRQDRKASNAIVLLTANELALPLSHAFEDLHMLMPVQGVPANFPSPGLHARYPSGKCAPSVSGQDLSALSRVIGTRDVIYFITRSNNVYDPNNRVMRFIQSIGFKQTLQKYFSPGALEVHKFVASAALSKSAPASNEPAKKTQTISPKIHAVRSARARA